MKSMRPPLVAIFYMTYFHRAGRPWPPHPPPDPLLHLVATEAHTVNNRAVSILLELYQVKPGAVKPEVSRIAL